MPLQARVLDGEEIDVNLEDCTTVSEIRSCIASSLGLDPSAVKLLKGDMMLDDSNGIAAIGLDSDGVLYVVVDQTTHLTVRVYLAGFDVIGKGLYDFGPETKLRVDALPSTEGEVRDILHAAFGVPSSEQRLSFVNPSNGDQYDRFQSQLPSLTVELKTGGRVRFKAGLPSGEEVELWATQFATAAQVRDQLLQGPPVHHNPRPPPNPMVADTVVIMLNGLQLSGDEYLCDRGLGEDGRIEIVIPSLPSKAQSEKAKERDAKVSDLEKQIYTIYKDAPALLPADSHDLVLRLEKEMCELRVEVGEVGLNEQELRAHVCKLASDGRKAWKDAQISEAKQAMLERCKVYGEAGTVNSLNTAAYEAAKTGDVKALAKAVGGCFASFVARSAWYDDDDLEGRRCWVNYGNARVIDGEHSEDYCKFHTLAAGFDTTVVTDEVVTLLTVAEGFGFSAEVISYLREVGVPPGAPCPCNFVGTVNDFGSDGQLRVTSMGGEEFHVEANENCTFADVAKSLKAKLKLFPRSSDLITVKLVLQNGTIPSMERKINGEPVEEPVVAPKDEPSGRQDNRPKKSTSRHCLIQ